MLVPVSQTSVLHAKIDYQLAAHCCEMLRTPVDLLLDTVDVFHVQFVSVCLVIHLDQRGVSDAS